MTYIYCGNLERIYSNHYRKYYESDDNHNNDCDSWNRMSPCIVLSYDTFDLGTQTARVG